MLHVVHVVVSCMHDDRRAVVTTLRLHLQLLHSHRGQRRTKLKGLTGDQCTDIATPESPPTRHPLSLLLRGLPATELVCAGHLRGTQADNVS